MSELDSLRAQLHRSYAELKRQTDRCAAMHDRMETAEKSVEFARGLTELVVDTVTPMLTDEECIVLSDTLRDYA